MSKFVALVKGVVILSFMVTLSTTYYLRSEVLDLNRIRFKSDNVSMEDSMRERKESYPDRLKEYEVKMKDYELRKEHYEEMLKLYQNDYEAYTKRLKDKYRPPQYPQKPTKPTPPEVSDKLAEINAEFRTHQLDYYDNTSRLNWVCCCSSLLLVGGLLFLIMFEQGNQKIFYLVILILSFVFMIGPSFHSIMSAIVGFLRAPPVY